MSKLNENDTYHLHVRPGHTAVYAGRAYGDRATLQVRGGDVTDELLAECEVVQPDNLPDVATRPEPAGEKAEPRKVRHRADQGAHPGGKDE